MVGNPEMLPFLIPLPDYGRITGHTQLSVVIRRLHSNGSMSVMAIYRQLTIISEWPTNRPEPAIYTFRTPSPQVSEMSSHKVSGGGWNELSKAPTTSTLSIYFPLHLHSPPQKTRTSHTEPPP